MMSRRAQRMEKRSDKEKSPGLNLISLMDIFTILVFFLLVNSSDVEVLPNAKDIQLPESIAEEKARENVVIMVNKDYILVQGRRIADTPDVLAQSAMVIPEIEQELRRQSEKRLLKDDESAKVENREVTIMGDKGLPYELLKRVMASCTSAQYGRISLAIQQKPPMDASSIGAQQ